MARFISRAAAAALAVVAHADSAASPSTVRFDVSNLDGGTTGSFVIAVHPDWAPIGAKRFAELVDKSFFKDVRFFRVVPNFMAQFGIAGEPKEAKKWENSNIQDDKSIGVSNKRGRVTFAMAGPGTRTTQMFVSIKDNSFLDGQNFPPFGEVVEGMEVVDKLYQGYGEGAPEGNGPSQGLIEAKGNEYLNSQFPKLSWISGAHWVSGAKAGSGAQAKYEEVAFLQPGAAGEVASAPHGTGMPSALYWVSGVTLLLAAVLVAYFFSPRSSRPREQKRRFGGDVESDLPYSPIQSPNSAQPGTAAGRKRGID